MEKYVRLDDNIVPKVWAKSYNSTRLRYELQHVIANHYLNLADTPRYPLVTLTPRAVLVVVEEKNYFLMMEEYRAVRVPLSERYKYVENNRHEREHEWLQIEVDPDSTISTEWEKEEAKFEKSSVEGYLCMRRRVNIPEVWATTEQCGHLLSWMELNLLVCSLIAEFYGRARHGLPNDSLPPICLNPPAYLWWSGDEFWFIPESEFFQFQNYEPAKLWTNFLVDLTYTPPNEFVEVEEDDFERELMEMEIPRLIQAREEYQSTRNYMLSIRHESIEE